MNINRIVPMSAAAAGISLALLATTIPLAAQNQLPERVVWLNQNGLLASVDAFGEATGRTINAPRGARPVHRAPDGRIWLTQGSLSNDLRIYDRDGTLHRVVPANGGFFDVAFGAGNEVFAVTAQPNELHRFDRDGTALGRTGLPGTPQAMALDGVGAVWVVAANMPTPFLSRRDPSSGALSTVNLPAGITGPADLLGLPQGGCRMVVEMPNQSCAILDVATDLRVVGQLDLQGVFGVEQIEQADNGTTWLSGAAGVHRLAPGSDVPIAVLGRRLQGPRAMTLDPLGALWVDDGTSLWRIDAATGAVDSSRSQSGNPEASDRFVRARVIAPLADDDGDGTANGVEIQLGTDPYDDQSSPDANLTIDRITYRAEERATFEVGGIGGVGVVLFAGAYDLNSGPIPGLLGDPRLDLLSLLPEGAPVPVPGRLDLRVPPLGSIGNALLCAQAVVGVAPPRFTNHDCTRTVQLQPASVGDTFATVGGLQRDRSAARLAPGGFLTTGPIGGTGVHGSFEPTDGRDLGNDVYEWSTDSQTIPAARTLFGQQMVVQDGRFEFTDFRIPSGTTVRFVGSRPAVIRVAGLAQIDGTLDLNGGDLAENSHDAKNSDLNGGVFTPGAGQAGTAGGAGAGHGGDGAFACDGTGNPLQPRYNDFNGFDGEDLQVVASHSYAASSTGTGGTGSALFPASGDVSSLVFRGFGNNYCINSASGGGGGGFRSAGSPGQVLQGPFITGGLPANPSEFGAPTPGGSMFPALDPRPAGATSLDHYLVSGSGGGGGGSHSLFVQASAFSDPFKFLSGGAGTGGGGAVALRVGSDLTVGTQGRIAARGGDGASTSNNIRVTTFGIPAPGGGGSGGSVLLQVGNRQVNQQGQLVVRGGAGSFATFNGAFYFADIRGGDGAAGSARLEVLDPNVPAGAIGQVEPAGAASVGNLTDRDVRTIALLGPYRLPASGVPFVRFRHYTIQAVIDGNPVVYTDAASGYHPANVPGAPLRAWFRAVARPGIPASAWRDFVNPEAGTSISDDLAQQIEVLVQFDRSIASDIRIDSLELDYWQ